MPAVLLVIVIWTIYYFSTSKPNQYMEDWYASLGTPDTLIPTIAGVQGKEAHLRLEQLCTPANHCNPSPAKDMSDWISRGIGHFTEDEAADCFRDSCQRVFDHEGHTAVVEFEKVLPNSWNFVVEVDLKW
ncbi:hypothetical protein [Actinomadura sp. GTD37]|uniref:hypothetical protein n=1 Tax=Actinomadura sp. GTD37 TaxID=1778030 RepID=UPI0035C1BDD2